MVDNAISIRVWTVSGVKGFLREFALDAPCTTTDTPIEVREETVN